MARARIVVVLLSIGLLATACFSPGPETPATEHLPSSIPQDFPLPPGSEFEGGGDDFAVRVPESTVQEVTDFYQRELPEIDWNVVENWQGNDPHGAATSGFVIEQAGRTGAIAFTGNDDEVMVRINLRQPTVRKSETDKHKTDKHDKHGSHEHDGPATGRP